MAEELLVAARAALVVPGAVVAVDIAIGQVLEDKVKSLVVGHLVAGHRTGVVDLGVNMEQAWVQQGVDMLPGKPLEYLF